MSPSYRITLPLFALAFSIAVPGLAHAGRDLKGRFGLGGSRTLAGHYQLHGRYHVLTHMSFGLGVGMAASNAGDDDPMTADPTIFLATISPEIHGWFLRTRETGPVAANFGVGGRVDFVVGDVGDTYFEIDVEVPIVAALYIGEHFAISPEAGLVLSFVPSEGDAFGLELGPPGGIAGWPGVRVGNAGLFGGGAFHFLF